MFKPELSDDENFTLYGKCSNPSGHGHNYILEVTVAGEPERGIGYVMDLKKLKVIVDDALIEKVDHKNLNVDVDFLKNIIPTSENIVMKFWEQLESKINNNYRKLYSLKLFETENNVVEYKGK
jgi:6-pyruvoyltetrahydropterin/6-carboxytetrahydropterin synthase